MMDPKGLLGVLLQSGISGATQKRLGHALGGSGMGDSLGRVLGEAKGGSPLAVGGIGALAGAVLGGRKGSSMRGAIGGGALALLGKLALDALQQRQAAGQGAAGVTTGATTASSAGWGATASSTDEDTTARLLLRAMLSAAKADGHIDGNEMQRILGKLDEAGADAETKSFLLDEMRKPVDVEELAREARTPELAAQTYAAALLAIEVDSEAEREYLRRLAAALGLDAGTVQSLHGSLGVGA